MICIWRGQNEIRKKLFRILLIFDEIILSKAPMDYEYKQLKSGGNFKIIPFEEFYYDNPIYKEEHNLYAEHLKPAITPVAEERLKSYFRIIPKDINYSDFISALYDNIIQKKDLPQKYAQVSQINRELYNLRNEHNLRKADLEKWPDSLRMDKRFYTEVSMWIVTMYEELCWQLQISSENDATIMN